MVLPTTSTKDPRTNILYRPYQPFGACLDLFYTRADEVLISGPAGTGKSRACLEKLHLCASKYPGMRGLMIRKTRESLTQLPHDKYEYLCQVDSLVYNALCYYRTNKINVKKDTMNKLK